MILKMKTWMSIALLATTTLSLTSCQKQTSTPTPPKSEAEEATPQGLKIAYVEVDSIMTSYNFATEYVEILKKKMETIQSTLNSKGLSLQNEVADFQNKIQQNKLTQEQATAIQASLQKKQTQLQNLQESLTNQYQEMQEKYNTALHDSIQNFLASYNKTHKYDYILSKSGDNILLANPKMNITEDVIKGLNKRYKKTEKK